MKVIQYVFYYENYNETTGEIEEKNFQKYGIDFYSLKPDLKEDWILLPNIHNEKTFYNTKKIHSISIRMVRL